MKKTTKITAIILSVLIAFSAIPVMNALADDGTKLLWSNSFETEDEQKAWTLYDLDEDGHDWEFKSSDEDSVFTAHDGKYSLFSESFTSRMETLTPDNIAISERIKIDDSSAPNIRINWYAASQEASHYEEHYSVYVFPGAATDSEIINSIKTEKDIFNETFSEGSIAYHFRSAEINSRLAELFPDKSSEKSIRIVFRHHDSTDERAVKIDAVTVEAFYNYDTLESYTFESESDFKVWKSIDVDGDGYGWERKTTDDNYRFEGYDDDSCVASASYLDSEDRGLFPENYLVSPAINISEKYYLPLLRWYVGAYDFRYYEEKYSVFVYSGNEELTETNIKTQLSDKSVSEVIFSETLPPTQDNNEFLERAMFLDDSYVGKTFRIVFVHHDCTEQYYLKLDNISLSAVVSPVKTITWDYGDGNTDTEKCKVGDIITAPENPTKEGYDFGGWEGYTEGMTMPGDDITFKAVWTPHVYNVNYYVGDNIVHTDNVAFGATIPSYTYTPGEGVSFDGWADSEGEAYELPATMPAQDINLYAKISVNNYNVTFTINGEEYEVLPFAYGAAVVAPAYEVAEGYTFSGWDVPATMPAQDITLDATLTANTYTAYFYLSDEDMEAGNYWKKVETVYGEEIAFPEAPEMDGYYFDAWDNDATVMGAGDMNFVAIFTADEYFVEVYNEDGTIINEWIAYWGDEIHEDDLDELTKEGFAFDGWFADEDLTVKHTFPVVVDGDVAFYAKFTVQGYKVIYNVDGEEYDCDEYEFGADITLRDALVKEGYTFSGWKDAEGNDAVLPETMPAEDITLYGTFTVNQYPATFNAGEGAFADGSTEKTIDVDYGTTPVAPEEPVLAGYNFDGWEPELAPMGVEGATYTAKFSVKTYKVIYNVDGKEYGYDEYEFGEAVTLRDALVKEGYTFTGWNDADGNAAVLPETMPEEDITVYGTFTVNKYTLTFINGSTESSKDYSYGEEILKFKDPTKKGYTFKGWNPEIPATMPAKDLVVTAVWEANTYIAKFIIDSETVEVETKFGEIPVAPEATKLGYEFTGWEPELAPMGDEGATYTAQFKVAEYEVKFDANGGTFADGAVTEFTAQYGQTIEAPEAPTKEGWAFAGWKDADGNIYYKTSLPEMGMGDITYTAEYIENGAEYKTEMYFGEMGDDGNYVFGEVPNEIIYSVAAIGAEVTAQYDAIAFEVAENSKLSGFVSEDGSLVLKIYLVKKIEEYKLTIDYGYDNKKEVELLSVGEDIVIDEPTRDGYTFTGWVDADGEAIIFPAKMPNEDVIITATWKVNRYTITFVDTGDVAYEAITQDYNTAISAVADPVKVGHIFAGWDKEIPEIMPAEDMTITAKWDVNNYKLIYKAYSDDAGKVVDYETFEVPFGTAVADLPVPENDPVREGYNFVSWSAPTTATMPAENVELTARWVKQTYTITFAAGEGGAFADGTTEKEVLVNYGETIDAPEAPTKKGHTFVCWVDADGNKVEISEMIPGKIATVTAKWEADKYKVTWIVPGQEDKVDEVAYGSAITAPTPEKEGYTFAGWDAEVPATMPDENLTFTGTWTANNYDATFNANGGVFKNGTDELVVPTPYDAMIEEPEVPVKTGYVFNGWNPALGHMNSVNGRTFNATWVPAKDTKYTVNIHTMNLEGEYDVATEVLEGTTDSEVKAVYTIAEGFELGENSVTEGNIAPDGSLVLDVYLNRKNYTITFDTKEGSEVKAITGLYGTAVTAPADPTKTGHTFAGWDKEIPATMPAENVTITASWTINTYDIIWEIGEETYQTDENVEYGATVTAPVPTKVGYDFSGWAEEIPETMPDNALTFTGTWIPREDTIYTVNIHTMNADGAYETEPRQLTGTTDSAVKFDDYTVETGFELGANSVTEGVVAPDGSLVLNVYLNRKTFTITFNTDSGSAVSAISGLYGSAVTAPNAPTKTGYKFKDWDKEIPSTMPAENMTINATYDCIATISIKNNKGSKTINHGETLKLTAEVTNQPSGTDIGWYVDGVKKGEGETFYVNPPEGGTVTVTVKLIERGGSNKPILDADGNEISDSEKVSMNSGFFQKIISFFKNLFRMDRTVVQFLKFINQ